LDDLLTVIVEKSSAVVEAERTTVFIYDPERERLWSRVAQGVEGDTIEVAIGSGVVGDVARTRKMANIPDAYADPRFHREIDKKTSFRTAAILCAPVLDSKGRLLGVIESINKATAARFDEQDEKLMDALAAHAAVAIQRAQATEVQLDHERFEQSLRVANEIQMRMLPKGEIALPDDAAFAMRAYIRPARQVGGDLYDFFWTPDHLRFCIGDVTGKGIGAALVMAVTKTLFRAHATLQDDPASLMSAINARLYEDTDPAMFVTAFCGFLDLRSGRLVYSNAGHDRPLLFGPGRPVQRMDIKSGLPLGVLPSFRYLSQELQLDPGETIFLYTDGVTEATNRAEELFSFERLRDVLSDLTDESPSAIVAAVTARVDQFAGSTPQADDITMLCIRYIGLPEVAATFPRDAVQLGKVIEFITPFLDTIGASAEARYAVELSVEELFTNFVRHNATGQGGIEIRLQRSGQDLSLTLTDFDTPRFDIHEDAPDPGVDRALDEREPGGLGLFLIKKLMDRVEYRHEGRAGTVTLRKRMV
ncbi:MAG: SpoIIE family protein phosphatase, partial [Thermoanaerobaculia bacterium]